MTQQESVGSRVARLRREKKLSIAALAKQVGVSAPSVWAWEKGKTVPRDERIPALAEALQVAETELIIGEPEGDRTLSAKALEEEVARSKAKIAALAGTSIDKVFIEIRL